MKYKNKKMEEQIMEQTYNTRSSANEAKKKELAPKLALAFAIACICILVIIASNASKYKAESIRRKARASENTQEVLKEEAVNTLEVSEEEVENTPEVSKEDEGKTEEVLLDTEEEDTIASVEEATLSAEGPSDTYYYHISEEDRIIIAKAVWAEARGECFEGKVAVAAVILNRYYSEERCFDRESIFSVVTQRGQFANIEKVTMENLEKNPECIRAVEAACKGWDPTRVMFENGALYFYAPKGVSGYQAEIREGIRVLAIGNHNFHYDFNKVS